MDCTVPIENIRGLIVGKNEPKTETIKNMKRKTVLKQDKRNLEIENQQKIFPDNKRCLLPKQKSPTPTVKDLFKKCVIRSKTEKNYVKENIETVKNTTCKEKQHIMQDSCDGHCQDLNRAGLELKYVFKKEYGKIPIYIQRNRHLIEKMKKLEQDDVNKEVPGRSMRYVDDEEKDAVLNRKRLLERVSSILNFFFVQDMIFLICTIVIVHFVGIILAAGSSKKFERSRETISFITNRHRHTYETKQKNLFGKSFAQATRGY